MAKVGGIFALTLLELDQHKMDPSISYRTFGSNNGIIISWDISTCHGNLVFPPIAKVARVTPRADSWRGSCVWGLCRKLLLHIQTTDAWLVSPSKESNRQGVLQKRILTKCQKKNTLTEKTLYLCQMNQREPERNWKIEISGLRTGGCHPCQCRCQWCQWTTRRSSPGNIWLMQPSCVGYVRPLHVKFATKKDNESKNWDGLCLRLVRACVVLWEA